MMVSSVCLRLSYLYLPLDGLVSLAEVFFAGQLDNDASVLTAPNNTKTHLSKHGPCFALTVFAAPLQFWCFSCLSQRGGLHFKERQSCNFVSTNLQFSPFCQQLSSRSIQSPISATRIFSVLPPSQPNSIAAHSRHANLVLWGVLAANFLTGNIPIILEQIDRQSNTAGKFNLRLKRRHSKTDNNWKSQLIETRICRMAERGE